MNIKRLLVFCFLAFYVTHATAQDLRSLLDKINAYHDATPIEKTHLHTDKNSYTAGETIWLKTYSTVGIHNYLSNISNIAYIELVSPQEEIISSIRIPIVTGIGFGDIHLTDTIVEGTYRIRAYTNWMRNDSSLYFFDENVYISNGRLDNILTQSHQVNNNFAIQLTNLEGEYLTDKTVNYEVIFGQKKLKKGRIKTDNQGQITIPLKEDYTGAKLSINFTNNEQVPIRKIFKLPESILPKNSIQFFPEGGNLLANSTSKIAIKTLKPNGLGVESRTTILTSTGDTSAIIETNVLGMGSSPLFIQNTEPLIAHTEFADGTTLQSELPIPQLSGYSIQVNNANVDKLFAQINVSPDKQDGNDIYFLAQHMGHVFYASKQPASKAELVFSFPKANLPNGVVTISVLDNTLTPVVERPVFMFNQEKTLPLSADVDSPSKGKREKVKVSIETGISSDTLRNSVLSASVINTSKLKNKNEFSYNILSSLLLSADVKGYIENPGYYFKETIKSAELDDLLLTQGWRKIDFASHLTLREPDFSPEKSIAIKGHVRKLGRKAPVPKAKMVLVPTHNFMDFVDTIANEEGSFEFDQLFFPDSIKFLITAKDEKGKNNIDIIVQEETLPLVSPNRNAPGEQNNINTTFLDELRHSKRYFTAMEQQGLMEKSIAIEEVIVTAQRPRHKASERSANLNGPGNADQVISAEELTTCATLEMCLNGRLMGVVFRNGVPHSTRGGGEMQVILDGMYVASTMLSMINPMDVQSVEVLRNVNYTAIYGSYGGNGLIIITSKTGADAMRSSYTPKGIATIQPKGFYMQKIFYKPVYEPNSKTILDQDFRTTIHWEPNIITDHNGKALFDFYTADEAGLYLITIEGLDFHGRLGRKTLTLEVK